MFKLIDGKDDLLSYSWTSYPNGGASGIEFNYYKRLSADSFDTTAKTTAITNVNFNLPFVVGDVNGDGYKDLVVKILTGSQTIKTYLNDGTGNFIPAANEYVSNEIVYAASDLNGDGKANITVYRDGLWYVLRSDFSTSGMYFGIANDVPFYSDTLQGPLLGVYRSSNSSVYTSYEPQYSAYAQAIGNSAGEIFVSSILPPQ